MARLLSVSIPDALAAEAEALARATGKTKSEVVRDALRRHVQHEHFAELQRYGRGRAEALGIGPEDVERLVDEPRATRT
jgi:metal-responsive CopG/Arc/MetJ family transcriptional regulator